MSLEEAKHAGVSARRSPAAAPSGSIDDILSVFADQSQSSQPTAQQAAEPEPGEPPPALSRAEAAQFYFRRGEAAYQRGNPQQSLKDIRKAFELTQAENMDGRWVTGATMRLAILEKEIGDVDRAVTLLRSLVGKDVGAYYHLASLYAWRGDFEEAQRIREEGIYFYNSLLEKRDNPWVRFQKARMEAVVLSSQGKYAEAEPFIREGIRNLLALKRDRQDVVIGQRGHLARNLMHQRRYAEAELEARQAVQESIRLSGLDSTHIAASMQLLAQVLVSQGRMQEAEKVSRAVLQSLQRLGVPPGSTTHCSSLALLGRILVLGGRYAEGLEQFDPLRERKETQRHLYDMFYGQNQEAMLALIMTNRIEEAIEVIDAAYGRALAFFGDKHSRSAELLAMRAMAYARRGDVEASLSDFSAALPVLVRRREYSDDALRNHRFRLILESYLELLSRVRGTDLEGRLGIRATGRAFEISSLLSGQRVQSAVVAAGARMRIRDPGLLELTRAEQDMQQQIDASQNIMLELLSRPVNAQEQGALQKLKAGVDRLTQARSVILEEIQARFPRYADLMNPQIPSTSRIQNLLKGDEVLVSVYSTENSTFVWVLPKQGEPVLSVARIGQSELQQRVLALREAVVPAQMSLPGRLPDFDFQAAHALYCLLLKPLEPAWQSARDAVLVAAGPVGQIPFSLLIDRPFLPGGEAGELFAGCRKAPWLVRRLSVSTLPSIASFVALRTLPKGAGGRKPFAGFGDPYFNRDQMMAAQSEPGHRGPLLARAADQPVVRGLRVTEAGGFAPTPCAGTIESLQRLPETAEEVQGIAIALGADPARDVFTGVNASERRVKEMDLSDRRVIVFASHALVPNDLEGLDQPALALSAPSVTGHDDDGLLTLAEILELKLNADWVVLSACNTGAAEGAGAEAVSGLGRAFFYAGTRALLVTMWPVESTSATRLTTAIFRHQRDNPGLSRAQAHRQAMLELIQGPETSHPFFWAPFMVVGDGG